MAPRNFIEHQLCDLRFLGDSRSVASPCKARVSPLQFFCYALAAKMRAAAILGLGSSTRDLKPFQSDTQVEWVVGLPAEREGLDAILVFGGDGTVHRHLAALVRLGLPVLVVPAGSGNDFARALSLFEVRDSLEAWRRFVAGGNNARVVDLGMITPLAVSPETLAKAAISDDTEAASAALSDPG